VGVNFGFTEEQELLRGEVRKLLDAQCPMAEVRSIAASGEGYSAALWKQIAELGWIGLGIPEAYGGAGLGWEEQIILLEETGRSLFPSPLLSGALAASLLLDVGSEAQRKRWLPRIADGSCIGTVALLEQSDTLAADGIECALALETDGGGRLTGDKRWVADAAQAQLLVVVARTGPGNDALALAIVERDAEGVAIEPASLLDATKQAAHISLDGVEVSQDRILAAGADAWPAIRRHLDRAAIAVSAEMLGATAAALDLTVQFAKDRVQFGAPIGRYQGVKHPLAERYVDVECMRSLVCFAAWALEKSPDEVPLAAAQAKAYASEALSKMGVDGIQLHGAVGYTEEYDIQLYLKRSKWARPAYGNENHHQDRIAELGGY
jgi:alkylation response protein AidB-like acyl-CoA dehydrogenase